MGKAPAFQFYPGDWVQDTRALSLDAKGAWIDILCAMWRSASRGEVSLSYDGYGRLIGTNAVHAKELISELIDMQICDTVTLCNGHVTLISRRMVRDERERNLTRNRVQHHRNQNVKRPCNANVTPPSSTSSSSSSSKEGTNMCGLVETDPLRKQAKEVIEYLNEATGSRFRSTGKSVDKVIARLREGFTVEDCKTVVDGQKLDPYFLEHPKYFRPETLFGSKFEGYLSAAPKQRMALETDPKRLIKDMRAEAEVRRFVEGTTPKQIGGATNETTGQGRICERSTTDGGNAGDRKAW